VHFYAKLAMIFVGLYVIALVFSFVSEVTYKKRSIADVRQDWKRIVSRTTIIFAVFVIASIIWSFYGPKGK
jgi:hypothetical protein